MIELQEHNGKLKVENYGLWEFLQDLQQGINQGYELDESNEGWPQVFGSLYTCLMVEKKSKLLPDKQAETSVVLPVDEAKDVLVRTIPKDSDSLITPWSQTESPVVAQETPEVDQPAKRGTKPKNK